MIRRLCLAAALLIAAQAGAQILDDTRGLGARRPAPPPADLEQLRRISDVVATIKREFVDVLEDSFLAERCLSGMDKALGDKRPKLPALARGAKPTVERIAEYWRELGRASMENAEYESVGDACLHGMVDNLDRRTEFMDRAKFRELAGTGGPWGALGLEIEIRDGVLTVVEPIEGTPGERMGFRSGDRLITIDGKPTAGLTLEDAVRLMRGKVGSTIELMVERNGIRTRMEGVRETIRVASVNARALEGNVLYLRLRQFAERTLEDLQKQASALNAGFDGKLAGVVLDLRGNPGGLLHTCIGIAAVFLPDKTRVVELKGRTETNSKWFTTQRGDWERGGWMDRSFQMIPEAVRKAPLVVLVDKRSAACSEIIASAMQDHKRAQVIGEKTFGLGTVQTIIPLAGSAALRLTTARFYRPSGEAIEEKAVTPDVGIAHPERFRGHAAADDPALPAALKALFSSR